MKRKILTLTLALLAALTLVLPASAVEYGVIYTETELLKSEELTDLGKLYLPRFTVFYDTDMRVDVLTSRGEFSSLEELAPVLYESYEYGYGEGRNGVTLTMLVHEDGNGVALDEWYLYAEGDNEELTSTGIQLAVDALRESMGAEDWAGDAEQDTQALVDAINVVSDTLTDFFIHIYGGAADVGEEQIPAGSAAYGADSFPAAGEAIGYVTDTAGILSADERQTLAEMAREISAKHDFGVYIITVDSFRDATDSSTVDDGAVTLYQNYDLGLGEEEKGVLLLLSMKGRDFSLITYSDYGNYIFDDVTREGIAYDFVDDFQYDDWFSGFEDYLENCDGELTDGPDKLQSEITGMVGMIFLIPLVIAAIGVSILNRKMKSVAKATEAEAYADGGLELTQSYDRFTHATETRHKRKEESSGGGGGKIHSSSSGGFGRTSGKF